MAFTEAQVKSLEAKLDSKHVKTRQAQDTILTYVEGWHVIAEANRIFGYDLGSANDYHPLRLVGHLQPAVRGSLHCEDPNFGKGRSDHDRT